MKRVLLTWIVMFLAVSLSVGENVKGDKVLTMEEAVIGANLRSRTKQVKWQGNRNVLTYTEGVNLIGESADKGQKTVLLNADDLNRMLGKELKAFPRHEWKDGTTLSFMLDGKYYEADVQSKELKRTVTLPEGFANLTASGKGVFAYTRGNNLYYLDEEGKEQAITDDKEPHIVNGQAVSRNEFGVWEGMFWSPDGKKLAFYRKDDSAVGTFPLLDITTRTGSLNEIKYPMAGMSSEKISLGIYDLTTGRTVFLDVQDFDPERYLTNIAWSPTSDQVYVQVLSRTQKHMKLNCYSAKTGAFVKTLLEEKNDKYVEPQTPIVFLKKDPGKFIYRTNNRDGYYNLYLVNTDGKVQKRITAVNADVSLVGEDGKYVYYTSAEVSPIDNHLFRVDLKSGKKQRLTRAEGWHTVKMSADMAWFVDEYNSLHVPGVVAVTQNTGKELRELDRADDKTAAYNFGEVILGTVKTEDGKFDLFYRLVKPMDFDPAKKYPVLLYVYGGPHSQLVTNTWKGGLRLWEMYMAQRGYVVMVLDNRGTLNRGAEFEKAIHGQCGQLEMTDQMMGINYLKSQPWVDAERIGVHGWSYGGFMTISLITNYPDVFKVAVAGGPVIDWKWYEIMYGERYMDSPDVNPEGYEKVSLLNKSKDLKGKLLICQGAIDPVVLWQHSLSFVRECIKHNVQVDYFPYPRAEHNVRGRDRIHLMQKVTNYFEDYLK